NYNTFCKLVQTSRYINMNGFMMVEPQDVPAAHAHLHMLFSNIILSDKAFMGSPVSRQGARNALDMAGIVWGTKDNIKNKPVMVSLINSLSPLKYSQAMCSSLIEFAKYGQPVVIASLIMAGTSGPIKLPGVLTLQNAEILAGLTLAQMINPGTPVIYGSASAITDMKTGGLAAGAVETSNIIAATAQIARYYNLPSRGGGALTNAHVPDIQAGIESAVSLLISARSGINFILHSCGILNSYLSMSFEKFLIDEELCGMVKRLLSPMKITDDEIGLATIKEVGIGGEYLSQPLTIELCKTEFFPSEVLYRNSYEMWDKGGRKRADETARQILKERIAGYEKPPIDEGIEKALAEYVKRGGF
ncbi:MAG: trimethylamine methyltransferase family protein, partial [Spirochaetota bacterium]